MGRITIFSLESCPHCKRAKSLIDNKGWAYTDISLSAYPEKRSDMLKLADRLTVPQIFFNTKHLGGATELDLLFESGDIDALYETMTEEPDPDIPELAPPSYQPKPQPIVMPRNEETICVGKDCFPYSSLMTILERELTVSTRKHLGSEYKLTFVGSDFVTFLLERFELNTRAEALQVGQSLVGSGFLHHISNDHNLEDSGSLLYRLHSHSNLKMLNRRRTWVDRVDDPMITVNNCKRLLNKIKDQHSMNGLTDYVAVAADDNFAAFEDAVCEFQKVDVIAMEPDYRKAFIINLYNLVVIHAFAKVGIPTTNLKRYRFYDQIGYEIGGHEYSLNDIENGILRSNSTPPLHLRRPFSSKDPRKPATLPGTDHRIHFALNCGAKSCPPIKKFSAGAIHEELRIAAMSFCEQDENVRLDMKSKTLWLTMIMSWYSVDFGSNKLELAKTVSSHLRSEKQTKLNQWIQESDGPKSLAFKVRYFPYDWTTDDAASAKFKSAKQRLGTASCNIS